MKVFFKTNLCCLGANSQKTLCNVLFFYLLFVFITTVVGSFTGYLTHNPWDMGDWLINYQGGMVRRGFAGELVYVLSRITGINPGGIVCIFHIFFYAVFFICSYLLLKKQHDLFLYIFLIFSPFIFTFQFFPGGYKKEIIYFALLSFFVLSGRTFQQKTFKKIFYVILLIYPLLILSHEMLSVFLPYFIIVFIATVKPTRKDYVGIVLLLIPSVFCFALSLYYSGTTEQVSLIFRSLSEANYRMHHGAIEWLSKSPSFGFEIVQDSIRSTGYVGCYVQVVLLSIVAFVPLGSHLLVLKRKLIILLMLISICGSIVLACVAIDWGRFIYIHLVSLFLLTFLSDASVLKNSWRTIQRKALLSKWNHCSYLLYVLLFFYSQCWHIPHCCNPSPYISNYMEINIMTYAKLYVDFYQMIF